MGARASRAGRRGLQLTPVPNRALYITPRGPEGRGAWSEFQPTLRGVWSPGIPWEWGEKAIFNLHEAETQEWQPLPHRAFPPSPLGGLASPSSRQNENEIGV